MTMMVHAYVRREQLNSVIDSLQALPNPIRPVFFTGDEGKIRKADTVADRDRFDDFRAKRPNGYMLYSDACDFGVVSSSRGSMATLSVGSHDEACAPNALVSKGHDFSAEAAALVVTHLAQMGAPFVFAAEEGEYLHRNRYVRAFPSQTVETWVGRDLERYLPGVYWHTNVELELARDAGLTEAEIARQDVHAAAADGRWTLSVARPPSDWKTWAPVLDEMCASCQGVFSLQRIRPTLDEARDYASLSKVIRGWR